MINNFGRGKSSVKFINFEGANKYFYSLSNAEKVKKQGFGI